MRPGRCWERQERPEGMEKDADAALEGSRRAHAAERPQQQPEIQCAGMQQHSLQDVVVTAQVHASHPSGFVEMRKRSFQAFASQTPQTLPPRTANAPAVAIDNVARLAVVFPVATPALRFRDVT